METARTGTLSTWILTKKINLANRESITSYQGVPPWELGGLQNIEFHTETKGGKNEDKERRRIETLSKLQDLGPFDYEVWTDGSVKGGEGAGAALLFTGESRIQRPPPEPPPDSTRPEKRRKTDLLQGPEFEIEEMRRVPAGRVCSSADAELVALEKGVEMLLKRSTNLRDLVILIASDSLSNLKALEAGPLRQKDERRKALWKDMLRLGRQTKRVVFMFVNSHVGITKNELADMMAADTLRIVQTRQDGIPVQLSGVRSKVTESLREKWRKSLPENRHRRLICGTSRADLGKRELWTRSEQCLVARMRCGEMPEIGPFMRRLHPEMSRTCRWCEASDESVAHCLGECPGLRDLRSRYEVRLETLSREGNREEIIRLQQFVHDATARINVEGGGKRKVPSTPLEAQRAGKKAKMGGL